MSNYPCTGRWKAFTGDGVNSPAVAAEMCHGCPILDACLLKALRMEVRNPAAARAGVWGGTTPKQRHLIATKGRGHRDAHRLRHLTFDEPPCAACAPQELAEAA